MCGGCGYTSWGSRARLGCERMVCSLGARWEYKRTTGASRRKRSRYGDTTEIQPKARSLDLREGWELPWLEAGLGGGRKGPAGG